MMAGGRRRHGIDPDQVAGVDFSRLPRGVGSTTPISAGLAMASGRNLDAEHEQRATDQAADDGRDDREQKYSAADRWPSTTHRDSR